MKRWQMYYSIHSMKNEGFSKRQIAKKLGISHTSYCQKENGFRPFTLWEVERILLLVGRTFEEVFARTTGRIYLEDTDIK